VDASIKFAKHGFRCELQRSLHASIQEQSSQEQSKPADEDLKENQNDKQANIICPVERIGRAVLPVATVLRPVWQ
jgi:hypothetical protein